MELKTYGIGELAREFKITLRTIRFYEDCGLLDPKRVGTTRIFNESHRKKLGFILAGVEMGVTIRKIKDLLGSTIVDDSAADLWSKLRDIGLENLEAERKKLAAMEAAIEFCRIKKEAA